jgi:hypothetical protein
MTAEQTNKVSVIDPIDPAIQRVKEILFSPFDLGKWFIIGFCAWLAYLGTGGGGGGNGFQWREPYKPHEHQAKMAEGINSAKEYLWDNLFWIAPAAVMAVVLIIAIYFLVIWLNSRGKFMFLHCVAGNKAEVVVPWHKFRKHGNSLFLFRVVLGVIGFAAVAVPAFGIGFCAVMTKVQAVPHAVSIPWIILCIMVIFALCIVLLLADKFTYDFVVPIMFLRTASCVDGWREFLKVLSANKSRFTLYILFQIIISIAIATIIFFICCAGCCLCCASVLLLIPYIGTVILLPIFVFKQAYPLYYLRQFGPAFDVFGT